MSEKSRARMAVGFFVLLGVVLFFGLVVLLGSQENLFAETTTIYVAFNDVGGLKPGSQVRLAGMNVGTVNDIRFGQKLDDKRLHVEMKLHADMMPRIRKDSTATIGTKGLLGDKVIELSIGSGQSKQLKDGDYIDSREPPDLSRILERGEGLIRNGKDLAESLKDKVNVLADAKTIGNVKDSIASLNNIVGEVEKGDGIVHGAIYDKAAKADLSVAMRNIRQASETLKLSLEHVENILHEVRTGKGVVHSLIYDPDGTAIVKNIRTLSEGLNEVVAQVKSGDGLLHTLVYDSDKGNLIRNLEDASNRLRGIVEDIDKGHGTIGGLIRDPTVYEDLKLILGNLKRNAVLKSLIRMSLEKNEAEKGRTGERARTSPEVAPAAAP